MSAGQPSGNPHLGSRKPLSVHIPPSPTAAAMPITSPRSATVDLELHCQSPSAAQRFKQSQQLSRCSSSSSPLSGLSPAGFAPSPSPSGSPRHVPGRFRQATRQDLLKVQHLNISWNEVSPQSSPMSPAQRFRHRMAVQGCSWTPNLSPVAARLDTSNFPVQMSQALNLSPQMPQQPLSQASSSPSPIELIEGHLSATRL